MKLPLHFAFIAALFFASPLWAEPNIEQAAQETPQMLAADILRPSLESLYQQYGGDNPQQLSEKLTALAQEKDAAAVYALSLIAAENAEHTKLAFEHLNKAAALGDGRAQYQLAMAYLSGEGAPKNDVQAIAWLKQAAKQGVVAAQYNLGILHQYGSLGFSDALIAERYYQMAADKGDSAAQYRLAMLYTDKNGVLYRPEKAQQWLALAAAQGHEAAQAALKAKE